MRTIAVESVAQYAVAVAEALGRDTTGASIGFPVLHPRASRLPPPAGTDWPVALPAQPARATPPWRPSDDRPAAGVMRWHAAARPTAPEPSASPVIGFGDADWALPAMLHAHLTGRPFGWFDDASALVEAVSRSNGPVTVCAAPGLLARELQNDLAEALSFTVAADAVAGVGFPARPLSYLTARTLPILTRTVAAHHRWSREKVRTVLGLFPERLVGVGDDETITCLDGDDVSAAAVRAAPDPDLLMMWGHSREDLFHLGPDALCGRSFDSADADPGAMVPTCVNAGSCIKQGELLPVNQLGASALVMGGCNVLRLGGTGLFAPEFSLAFSALEGGASVVVTSSGVVIGSPVEFLFLYRLLRGGLPVGEAVRLLNAALPFLGPDSPSYHVLGEGDRVLFNSPPGAAHARRSADGGEVRVEFREVSAEYLTVHISRFSTEVQVRFADDSPARPRLYSSLVPHADGTATVYLYGPQRLEGPDFTVSISNRRPGGDAAAAVLTAMTNYQAYGKLLRGYHPKIKSLEPEWRSTATYLVRHAARARYDVRACTDTDRRAASTDDAVHALNRGLLQHYLERTASARGFTFHEQYLFDDATFTVTRHSVTGPCPYCGDQLMERAIRSSLVPTVRRAVGICRTCGTIWDRPEQLPAPLLSMDPVLRAGVPRPVALELHNPLDRVVRGWAGLTVRRARQFGYLVEPAMHEVILRPDERRTVTFSLVTTAVPTDAEFLRGFWSGELTLAVAQRTIWTAPGPGPAVRPIADLRHLGDGDG